MKETTYTQIMEELNTANMTALPALHVVILRNVMIEPIEPYLRWHALRMGYNEKVHFGAYDNIVQEAMGENSDLFNEHTDVTMVFMQLETVSWDLARKFTSLSREQVQAELGRIEQTIHAVLHGIRRKTQAMILWHGFETPLYPAYGIYDGQIETGQKAAVADLNSRLRTALVRIDNAYFVDIDQCLARVGQTGFYDRRYWHLGRAPYARSGLAIIAAEDFRFVRSLRGKNRKCLILDCDDTLWGGILGEEGLSGIKLGKAYPGSVYYEFQQEIVNLVHRGIIIALCSKNNEADVWDVFDNHPDMVLRRDQVAAWQINWGDKAQNIRQLALDLNIGLDSMVFADDSEFEINLIRKELPEVEVIHLSKEKNAEYRDLLAACGFFDTLTVTAEDRERGAMYRAENFRKQLQVQATDMESYYRSLEMVVDIRFADTFSIPRVAQQTQKTNQFNLTTRRYNETQIRNFVENPEYNVVTLQLTDRFGDYGLVGTGILEYRNDDAIIDTLLLSCRALGRGVEDVFLSCILTLAKKRGARRVVGEFYRTKKNAQVEDFYARQGFSEASADGQQADRVFYFDLTGGLPSTPAYFKSVHFEAI